MFSRSVLAMALLCATPMAFAHSVNYNLFLIPSDAVRAPLTKITENISAQGLSPLLKEGYLPHVTLYLTQYPESALPQIQNEAKTLASQWHPFVITFDKIEQTKGNWLLLNVKDNANLQRLANEATLALSPLRDKKASLPNWVKNYPEKIASFKRYGSPNTFAQFQPHITLLPASNGEKIQQFMMKDGQNFQPITINAVGIGIAQDNANGQAKHPIATYFFPTNTHS